MLLEEFQAILDEHMPNADTDVNPETGEISIDTGLRVMVDGETLYVVPLQEPLPDNVISLLDHPKFRAAHHIHEHEDFSPPPNLME